MIQPQAVKKVNNVKLKWSSHVEKLWTSGEERSVWMVYSNSERGKILRYWQAFR
jgi:hypothetical protein